MFEKAENLPEITKREYHDRYDQLSAQLMLLQQRCKQECLPVVILFEGWGSSGKGSRISDLVVNLDPRLFSVHTIEDPIGHEDRLPFAGRFWSRIGEHGTMTIFDQAWYEGATRSVMETYETTSWELSDLAHLVNDKEKKRRHKDVIKSISHYVASIQSIERQLIDDGYLIVKFFLHISEEEQRSRFVKLMLDPETSWRVNSDDIKQVQRYEDYYHVFNNLLELTDSEDAPWHVVVSQHKRSSNIQIIETLISSIEEALEKKARIRAEQDARTQEKNALIARAQVLFDEAQGTEREKKAEKELVKAQINDISSMKSKYKLVEVQKIDEVAHDFKIEDDAEYKRRLKAAQKRLQELQKILYRKRIPMIIGYEGWDAAGKGGNIKRVARALDARSYAVHPISAPTAEELAHPFLWRFWKRIPRTGHIAIFDRTWYGRVMVERVERFAREDEWMRAYDEINDFEAELQKWGAILIKFWINVSEDEQLNRFEARQNDPAKQWKITEEDWRNRKKNNLYKVCIDDMLRLTSTEYAPWHIVESDDKHFARVKALEIIIDTVEKHLGHLAEE